MNFKAMLKKLTSRKTAHTIEAGARLAGRNDIAKGVEAVEKIVDVVKGK